MATSISERKGSLKGDFYFSSLHLRKFSRCARCITQETFLITCTEVLSICQLLALLRLFHFTFIHSKRRRRCQCNVKMEKKHSRRNRQVGVWSLLCWLLCFIVPAISFLSNTFVVFSSLSMRWRCLQSWSVDTSLSWFTDGINLITLPFRTQSWSVFSFFICALCAIMFGRQEEKRKINSRLTGSRRISAMPLDLDQISIGISIRTIE